MDDPWANAWGEPSKPTFSQPSSSNWSAPSVSTIHGDHEDDISTRSWSVEPTTHWDEPNVTEALWSNKLSSTWQPAPSTFDTIPLSTVSIPALQFHTSTSEEAEKSLASSLSIDSPPPSSPISETSVSLSLSPKLLHPSRPTTPDVFGTFKGAESAHESWSPAKPTFSLPSADADAWGPSWSESNDSVSAEDPGTAEELDNAWETAKQQKERQDRHVPPELLASILHQLEEMSGEFWPDIGASTSVTDNEDVEMVVPAFIAQILMPDDMAPPLVAQFAKTFVSKRLTEALKLTKHAPQTHLSPMIMYMSSKGSSSWEASIKSQPVITHDDFAPAGWRIAEVAKEGTVVDDGKKKAGNGLLSFFGRRTTSSQSDTVLRSTSPVINSSVISSLKSESSPRTSTDNTRSTATICSGRTTPALPIVISLSSSISAQQNESNLTASSIASDSIVRESTPPSSAVSRFLGRFSSRASKPRDSLALSQDDLEFLSDVPTLDESEFNHDSGLDALSMMIKSPLPTMLPPPLPPPSRPPQPIRTLSQAAKSEKDLLNDDPFLIFSSSDSASEGTHLPMKPLIAASTSVGSPLSNSSLSSTPLSLAHNRSSESTITSQEWPSFGGLPASTPTKRVVAVMTPPSSSSTPPPILKPKPAFPMPSQGSSSQIQWLGRDSPASKSMGMISPLPPPPGSRSHTPSHTIVQVATTLDDDDDFSDFLSSPAQSAPPVPPSFAHKTLGVNLGNSSSSVAQTSTTTNSIFDGFDDFLKPFSSDPQPPPPPAKQKLQPFVPESNFPPPSILSTQSPQHSRTVLKTDHSRTLSLLENAAARGQWFGPASPLPEALPPPDSSNVKLSSNGLFEHGSTMQAQQAQAAAALSVSFQAPLKVDEKDRSQNSSRYLTPAHLLQLPVSSHPSTGAEVKSGGLSAQDLSFFEGL